MSVRSTPASALRQPHFSATPWTERSAAGAAATPAERRLTAQVARAETTLRDVRDELEERTRLLARTKQSIESLQQDLQRARDSEISTRALARERQDADTRRIAELERQLAETKGDETHNDVSRRALVDRLASLERAFASEADGAIDAVWMLAAPLSVESARDPAAARDVVVGGLRRLLKVMGARGVPRICFSDSIGSFGAAAPRERCAASWLAAHPEQDPGSAYGRQKCECREIMREWVAEDRSGRRSARFAVIPGVLHTDETWGDGTTEYALEACKCAAEGTPYVCPIDHHASGAHANC